MSKGSGMTLNVDDNLVRPVVEKEIQAAIVRQLEATDDLIPKMVNAVLLEKVTRDGSKPRYSSDEKYDFVEYTCREAIKKAARAALRKYIEEHAEQLEKEIAKQMARTGSKMAKIFVEGITKALESSWSFRVTVALPGQG